MALLYSKYKTNSIQIKSVEFYKKNWKKIRFKNHHFKFYWNNWSCIVSKYLISNAIEILNLEFG